MINLRKKPYIIGLSLIALSAVGLFYLSNKHKSSPSKKGQVLGKATGLTIHQFDNTGKLHFIGTANSAIHYTTNTTSFKQVKVTLLDPKQKRPPWHINADRAFVWGDKNHINLTGHVVFLRNKSPKNRALKLQTSTLDLYTLTHEANTDKKIMISEPNTKNITTATGMRANWRKENAHLLHNVASTYEPATKH